MSSALSDPRFSFATKDPRFKRSRKDAPQFTVDKRFSKMFNDRDFAGGSNAKVDAKGRPRKEKQEPGQKLKKFYKMDEETSDVVVDSHVSPEDDSDGAPSIASDEEGTSYISNREMAPPSSEDEGSSGSSSDFGDLPEDFDYGEELTTEPILIGEEATKRIAVQNLEWDRVKALDILVLLKSFLPDDSPDGIESVTVYPSDFGKRRMEEEKRFGPIGLYKSLVEGEESQETYRDKIEQKVQSIKAEWEEGSEDEEEDEDIVDDLRDEESESQKAKMKGKKNNGDKEKKKRKGKGKEKKEEEEQETTKKSKSKKGKNPKKNSKNEASLDSDDSDNENIPSSSTIEDLEDGASSSAPSPLPDDDGNDDGDVFPSNEDESDEVDPLKLRKYELDRLRYFYAIVECESLHVSQHLYRECDALEFESTANKLDLRFVPDGVDFSKEKPRDTATTVPINYSPPDYFATKALQMTNVDLTWDMDDPNRSAMFKKKFNENDDDDLQVYLADDDAVSEDEGSDFVVETSDEEEDEFARTVDDDDNDEDNEDRPAGKKKKKVLLKKRARSRYSELLAEIAADKSAASRKSDIDREIVFQPALKALSQSLTKKVAEKEKKGKGEEESLFMKKFRERKEKKKLEKKAKKSKEGEEGEDEDGDGEGPQWSDEEVNVDWNDPFFKDAFADGDYEPKTLNPKEFHSGDWIRDRQGKKNRGNRNEMDLKGKSKRESSHSESADAVAADSALSLLVDNEGSDSDNKGGFDVKALVKQNAKDKKNKEKKNKKKDVDVTEDEGREATEGFSVDPSDKRFASLYSNPDFSIDPTHPKYKATKGTEDLIKHKFSMKERRERKEEKESVSDPKSNSLTSLVSSVVEKTRKISQDIDEKTRNREDKVRKRMKIEEETKLAEKKNEVQKR